MSLKQVTITIGWLVVIICIVPITNHQSLYLQSVCAIPTDVPSAEATQVSSLEDPSESAATSGSDELDGSNRSAAENQDICLSCYDRVRQAEYMIAIHNSLLDKQRRLLRHKTKMAAAEEARRSSSSNGNDQSHSNKPYRMPKKVTSTDNDGTQGSSRSQQQHQPSTVFSTRTLQSAEPIVVSTLRVARAAISDGSPVAGRVNGLNKKDPELKRLKQEQQQQLNATCKALYALKECLNDLSKECIGNLQYHSLEVYEDQWYGKLNCPYKNNPTIRVFTGIGQRSYINEDEKSKAPIARPISSSEEVRLRLHEMFPNGFGRPFRVQLTPTLTTTAAQKFSQLPTTSNQPQQQESNKLQQLRRDFSGHLKQRQILFQRNDANSGYQQIQDEYNIGKTLLVPCCVAILVAVVALASLYYWL